MQKKTVSEKSPENEMQHKEGHFYGPGIADRNVLEHGFLARPGAFGTAQYSSG